MNKLILLIGPEPLILQLTKINLERRGYEVMTAPNDDKAREIIEREKPDICVHLDKEGMKVLKQFLAKKPGPPPPPSRLRPA